MEDSSEIERVLIVSADVAGGHDAAAKALKEQILEDYPQADIFIENGLAWMGPWARNAVRNSFSYQLCHASWVYGLLFWFTNLSLVCWISYRLFPAFFAKKMQPYIENISPDIVVSTYPMCTSVLAGLRRKRKLNVPLFALVTDVNPHRMWFAPGVDKHLVTSQGDLSRVAKHVQWAKAEAVSSPLNPKFVFNENDRIRARVKLGLSENDEVVLVTGGSWGVGPIKSIVKEIDRKNRVTIVACAHNSSLLKDLNSCEFKGEVKPIAFTDLMPEYMKASDLIVATGAGLTVFEAIAANTPVLMTEAIPGHGVRSARALKKDRLISYVKSSKDIHKVYERACKLNRQRDYVEARLRLINLSSPVQVVSKSIKVPVQASRRFYISWRSLSKRVAVTAVLIVMATSHSSIFRLKAHIGAFMSQKVHVVRR